MMIRFEDSPELFGGGCGSSTVLEFTCHRCGTEYNKGNKGEEDNSESDEYVRYTIFAGMKICGACFAAIECDVLRRIPEILPWYRNILAEERARLEKAESLLANL